MQLTAAQLARWDDSKQTALYVSMGVFLVLGNLVFVARLYCQSNRVKGVLIEDVALLVALIMCNAGIIMNILSTHNGLGLHYYRIIAEDSHPGRNLISIYRNIYITASLQAGCLATVKVALLYLYRRIFLVNQRWLKITWWGNFAYVVIWFFASIFFYIFQCSPVNWYWDRFELLVDPQAPHNPRAFCSPVTKNAITATLSLNLVSDIALLLLPGVTIATLHISSRKKLGLGVVFGFGLIASGVSLARIVSLQEGKDPTYDVVSFIILSSAEQMTAIVCACWPIIVPEIARLVLRQRNQQTQNDQLQYQRYRHKAPFPEPPSDDLDELPEERRYRFTDRRISALRPSRWSRSQPGMHSSNKRSRASRDMLDLHSSSHFGSNNGRDGYAMLNISAGDRTSSSDFIASPTAIHVKTDVSVQRDGSPFPDEKEFPRTRPPDR